MNEGSYHHGDLPTALRSATAELIAERGPTGFSLREVARRAGVSHAAPTHHFGGSTGLLTSVAVEGFQTLQEAFDAVIVGVDDPVEKLVNLGKAYVRTALDYPGHFGIMCNKELINSDDPEYQTTSGGARQLLTTVVTEIGEKHNPTLDVEAASTMVWAAVHGLAVLIPSMIKISGLSQDPIDAAEDLVEKFSDLLMEGFDSRPAAG